MSKGGKKFKFYSIFFFFTFVLLFSSSSTKHDASIKEVSVMFHPLPFTSSLFTNGRIIYEDLTIVFFLDILTR